MRFPRLLLSGSIAVALALSTAACGGHATQKKTIHSATPTITRPAPLPFYPNVAVTVKCGPSRVEVKYHLLVKGARTAKMMQIAQKVTPVRALTARAGTCLVAHTPDRENLEFVRFKMTNGSLYVMESQAAADKTIKYTATLRQGNWIILAVNVPGLPRGDKLPLRPDGYQYSARVLGALLR